MLTVTSLAQEDLVNMNVTLQLGYAMDRGNFEERQAIATGVGDMTRSQHQISCIWNEPRATPRSTETKQSPKLERTDHSDEQGGTGMDAAAAPHRKPV